MKTTEYQIGALTCAAKPAAYVGCSVSGRAANVITVQLEAGAVCPMLSFTRRISSTSDCLASDCLVRSLCPVRSPEIYRYYITIITYETGGTANLPQLPGGARPRHRAKFNIVLWCSGT